MCRYWAAEKVESGCRNISNCLSIGTKIDLCSQNLKNDAKSKGWWDGKEAFHWAKVMGGDACGELKNPDSRWRCGKTLLENGAQSKLFRIENMMEVLRDETSGINRPGGDFPTAASQVSSLGGNGLVPCHWMTASLAPSRSEPLLSFT